MPGSEEGDHNVLCIGCRASCGACDARRARCWAQQNSCGAGLGSGLAFGDFFFLHLYWLSRRGLIIAANSFFSKDFPGDEEGGI